jgi:hypothetical protein
MCNPISHIGVSVSIFRLVEWWILCCDGVRLSFQNCGLGPIVLSPDDSDVDLGRRRRLGLTHNSYQSALAVTRDICGASRRWAKKLEFSLFIPVGLKDFFYMP